MITFDIMLGVVRKEGAGRAGAWIGQASCLWLIKILGHVSEKRGRAEWGMSCL